MRPGDEIGGYVIEEKLGEGGMGEVWRARPVDQKQPVAIKLLRPEYCNNPEILERFYREARAQMTLDHPNIVPVIKLINLEGRPGFVLPLYTGGSLEKRIRSDAPPSVGRPLPQADVFSISKDVLRCLDFAHRSGWIHCDIKPSNILFDSGGHASVTDFGIALEMGRVDRTVRGVIGTPEYMSPEQIRPDHKITHQTDVYSFGCCLFEMLTGETPSLFRRNGSGGTFRTALQKVPLPLQRLVTDALAENMRDRISGCQEFLCRLEKIEQKINRQRYGWLARFVSLWRQFGKPAMASAATIVLLSGGYGFHQVYMHHSSSSMSKYMPQPAGIDPAMHQPSPAPSARATAPDNPVQSQPDTAKHRFSTVLTRRSHRQPSRPEPAKGPVAVGCLGSGGPAKSEQTAAQSEPDPATALFLPSRRRITGQAAEPHALKLPEAKPAKPVTFGWRRFEEPAENESAKAVQTEPEPVKEPITSEWRRFGEPAKNSVPAARRRPDGVYSAAEIVQALVNAMPASTQSPK